MTTPEELHEMVLRAQQAQRERDAEAAKSKQNRYTDRIEEEKKRRKAQEEYVRQKKAEQEAEWAIIRAAQKAQRERVKMQYLEQYCADVPDPKTRAELVAILTETRKAFLEE